MEMINLLYLHGFNSSPASFKARVMQRYMDDRDALDRIHVPAIPGDPVEAAALIRRKADSLQNTGPFAVIGSSLGGFYATWIAEQFDCRAVLVNPAVRPWEVLKSCIGKNTNLYTWEQWTFTHAHIEALRHFECDITGPERYLVMLQTADDVLDYRKAVEKYHGAVMSIEAGGSHAFDGFENHIDHILSFCNASS